MQLPASAQTLANRWSFFNAPGGGTTVTDSVAGVVATLQGTATLTGSSLSLDGSSGGYVSLAGGLLSGMQSVSLEGWAESAASPDNVHLFEFSDGAGTGNAYLRYVLHADGNAHNHFELADVSGYPNQSLNSSPGWGGVPVHVVCVYDPVNGLQAIYTNGILEALNSFPANQTPLSSVSTNEASLGQSPWYNYSDPYMAGSISEFRIWNGALSPLQIAALDAAGATTVSTNYGTVTGIQLQVAFTMQQHALQQAAVFASASGLSVQPNVTVQASFSSSNTNILTVNASGLITAVAQGSAMVMASFAGQTSAQTITVTPLTAAISNRWSFYTPPAGSLTVTDSVNGVIATLNGDANLDGTAVNLDGTSGTYVSLGSGLLSGLQTVTLEGWMTTNSVSPDNVHLFSFDDGNGTGTAYLRYVLHASGNTHNNMELADVPGENNQNLSASASLGGIGRLHVVCIYDPVAQIAAIFTNGMLEASATGITSALSGVSTNDAVLGRSPWYAYGDPYLNGSISEFRIYNGELTPQKIAMDYVAGPNNYTTNGPGALQSVSLNLPPTIRRGDTITPPLYVTYANLTNFNLTANSIFPVGGLVVASSNTNVVSVNGNNQLTAVANGTASITAIYQGITNTASVTVITPPFKYMWSAPVSFNGMTADQILGNVPGTIVGAAVFGGTPQTVTLTNGQVINFTADGSVATTTGNGTFSGAYPAGTANTTGNANFDAVLAEASYDGGPKTISLNNLTVGGYYSVQLFGLDDRSPESSRLASYQDPNYSLDVSPTFTMGTNAYVVGTFVASSATMTIQMNLPTGNNGNMNALVVRQAPVVLSIQTVGSNLQLAWPVGTLLQAPSVTGPWTTNSATSPYTFTPSGPQEFYRVRVQ